MQADDVDSLYLRQHTNGLNSIADHTAANSGKYKDSEFLPVLENVSKYNKKTWSEGVELGSMVALWVRPQQIRWAKEVEKYPLTVFNQPGPMDIIQGRLGNCWFTSALSLIAGKPTILQRIMITKEYNAFGLYRIRLCNRGIWQIITIDDMLPVTQANGLVFTRSRKKQLFASLIEKALAKMYRSYDALDCGRCVAGLQILAGEPCEVLHFRSNDPKRAFDTNDIWKRIVKSHAKGYLMTCLCSNPDIDEHLFEQMGLAPDHAYSILDVSQVSAQRALRLRNPWGQRRKDDVFNNHPIKSSKDDGNFWLAWEQVATFFSDITICKINTHGYKARKSGRFCDFSTKITSVYSLHCPYGAELELELFNASDAKYCASSTDCEIDLFLILLSSSGHCQAYVHGLDYYITMSTAVPPGQYTILAGSISAVNDLVYSKFNLAVHSSQSFTIHDRVSPGDFLANAFYAVALKVNKRKDFTDGVSILTTTDTGGFGFICENRSNRAVRLTTDFQGSMNVFSSRRTFNMVDIIPAKTRQLFAMFTRKAFSCGVSIVYNVQCETLNQSHGAQRIRFQNNPPIRREFLGLHMPISTDQTQ